MTEPLEDRLLKLERDLREIKTRNMKVEADKAWETSVLRRVLITVLTYGVTSVVFWLIAVPAPLLNALIPTVGYFLSTLTIGYMKDRWIRKSAGAP